MFQLLYDKSLLLLLICSK